MNTREALIDARARISDPARWCRGLYHNVGSNQWCAEGSWRQTCDSNYDLMDSCNQAMRRAVLALYGTDAVVYINDTMGHEAVMRAYDHAIEHCSE